MTTSRRLILLALATLVAGCCPFRRIAVVPAEAPTCAAHGGPEVRWTPAVESAEAESETFAVASDSPQMQTFLAVWTTIRDGHYGPESLGVDWNRVRTKYTPRAMMSLNTTALYRVINQMLGELGQSHCAAMPPFEPEPAPAAAANEAHPPTGPPAATATATPVDGAGPVQIGDPGMIVRVVDGQACIVWIAPDSGASKAGIKAGSILRAVDGRPIKEIPAADAKHHELMEWTFRTQAGLSGIAGQSIKVTLAAAPGAAEQHFDVGLSPVASASLGHLGPIAAPFESRVLEGGIGYVRLGSFFTPVFEEYQKAMKKHRDGKGLIIDLRGNPGGLGVLGPAVAGYLTKERLELGTSCMKSGELRFPVFPRPKPFTGPVAILMDETSASTSEIVAGGLQEAGRARLFGRRTAGAVLPSFVVKLPDGGLLQYPTADFVTPKGVRLEGRGAIPDEVVWWSFKECAAGRDPILDAAVKWLREQK